ncbi:MAG: chiD [Fibrobacteres bacterium]|nr:chiD [Fibrobacterota bacterium]
MKKPTGITNLLRPEGRGLSAIGRAMALLPLIGFVFGVAAPVTAATTLEVSGRVVVGYWHNWENAAAPFIRLKDVPDYYNVVCVSFAESTSPSDMTMKFAPELQSEESFIADVKALQAKGKKVLLSLGGQNGHADLSLPAEKQKFIESMDAIIKRYGLNGLDIDLEGGSIHLGAGDTDFRKPVSPLMVNLIDAIRTLRARNGESAFWITAAPEIAYVQGGIAAFAGIWGAYLPLLYGLKDVLTYVHVQYYNAGGNDALDGKVYNQGTADFLVAMTEMLLAGFPLGGNKDNFFPGFAESQVAFGIPAVPAAASSGYIAYPEVLKALDYLTKGKSFGGSYVLRKPGGYPGLRGIMTWSVNWDAPQGYKFGQTFAGYFTGLPSMPPVNLTRPAIRWKGRSEGSSLAILGVNGAYLGQIGSGTGSMPGSWHESGLERIPRGAVQRVIRP